MYYLGDIVGVAEKEEGTYLKVFIPQEKILNKLNRYKVGNSVKIEIRVDDGRTITNDQRKKYFATIKDICYHTGHDPDFLDKLFKAKYCILQGLDIGSISMKNCSVTAARELINMLMDYAIEEGVQLQSLGALRTDDIDRFIYYCIKNRRCSICGKSDVVHLHHIDGAVGMGRNRNDISHIGMKIIALCALHHKEAHDIGDKSFKEKHHIYGIIVNNEIENMIKNKQVQFFSEDLTDKEG